MKRKKISLNNIAIIVFITTILATCVTLSRYKSTFAALGSSATIAKPIIKVDSSQVLNLEKMKPGDTNEYIFSVKNHEEQEVSDIVMGYTIRIETGCYLPLIIELYSVNNGIVGTTNLLLNSNITDEQELNLLTNTHDYKLVITWDGTVNDYRYSEEIDYVNIIVNGYQKNSEE